MYKQSSQGHIITICPKFSGKDAVTFIFIQSVTVQY
jgi:hypothetical protein